MGIIQTSNNPFISSVNPKELSKKELTEITELEQDMWAREEGLGHYLQCEKCGITNSKEEIYLGLISSELLKETCANIERVLGKPKMICGCCGGKLKHMYDPEKHIEVVRYRYVDSVLGLLSLYKDPSGEVVGFFDGFLDSFGGIFEKEFKNFHKSYKSDSLKGVIEQNTGLIVPDTILVGSAVGMKSTHKSFITLYNLIKEFFYHAQRELGDDVFGITEAPLGTTSHSIYHSAGAVRCNIEGSSGNTDIFVQPHITADYVKNFGVSPREYLKMNGRKMKEVIVQ